MTSNNKNGCTLATSFTIRDIRALLEFHKLVLRGGDARQVAASAPIVNVVRKFQAMQEKQRAHDAQKGNGSPCHVTSSQ